MLGLARLVPLAVLFTTACVDDPHVDKVPDSGDPDGGDPDGGDTDTGSAGSGDLTVTFIDVGQGDATLLEMPDGRTVLVDGGDNGEGFAAILPLLDDKGIEVVDLMVLTHPHSDHCGGLDEVLLAKDVLEVWENGETLDTATYDDFADARNGEGAQLGVPDQGDHRAFGEATITILNTGEGYEGENNDSIVLSVEFGQRKILLTGDVEALEQEDLVDDYGDALACDALKVPHHGSWNQDSEFISFASPTFAVISCGEVNDYGHPHQVTIDAYLEVVDELCITFEAGDSVLWTDGSEMTFECAAPRLP